MLPKDNIEMLVSILNTKLRDFYSSFSDMCEDLDESEEELLSLLNSKNYYYNHEQNRIVERV